MVELYGYISTASEYTMAQWQNYILTFTEYITYIFLLSGAVGANIIGANIKKYVKPIIVYAIIFLLVEASKSVLPESVSIILLYTSLVLFIKITFEEKILSSMAICGYTSFMIFSIQGLFTTLLGLFIPSMDFLFRYGIIVMVLTIVLSVLLYLFAPLYKILETIDNKKEFSHIIVAISVTFLFFMYNFKIMSEDLSYIQSYGALIITIAPIIIGYYVIKLVSENLEKNEALKQYRAFENMISEHTKEQYNLNNDLGLVYSLALINDNEKTLHHIKKHLNNLDGHNKLIEMERKPLAMYLYVKIKQLKDIGINCHLKIDDYRINFKIADYKLIKAVDIVVENAWEALDGNDDKIYVSINNVDGKTVIEVLNKHEEIAPQDFFNNFFKKHYSTKDKTRGLGLYHLDRLSEKNEFIISCENRKINNENYVCFALEF